jgi:Pentapeptide repeats (8 copies)
MGDAPPPEGCGTWNEYWTKEHRQPWRTKPEIDAERQTYLAERRAIAPDIVKGIYSFRDEQGSIQLTRADVEWLLATHESGGLTGPVEWDDPAHRRRSGLDLRGADISGENLSSLPLSRLRGGLAGDEFFGTTMDQFHAAAIRLVATNLRFAHLEGSILTFGRLDSTDLSSAHLESADLYRAHFEAEQLADIGRAVFDSSTILNHIVLANSKGVGPQLADVLWNGAILSAVEWASVRMLGEEYVARYGTVKKPWSSALGEYPSAVRANRQVSAVLRGQGLHEEADRFAYRAHSLQRIVFWRQRHYLRASGSWLLDLISGYGYKPIRSFIVYLLVVGMFALAYYLLGNHVSPPLDPLGAVIFSITSFHGRGFAPGENVAITNPLTVFAAVEAIIGLLIEITFIATFTQRFFAR